MCYNAAMKKLIAAFFAAMALACAAAGDPYDYKKTVQRRVAPATVTNPIAGRALVDFGKEAFGFLEFTPPKGTRGAYEVRLGELVKADGSVNMKPGGTIRAARIIGTIEADGVHRVPLVADKRNTSGGREGGAVPIPPEHGVIMPFRYAEVFSAPFPVNKDTVRMVAVNYPINMDESAFACDNVDLVKIYDFCKYSMLATSFAGLYVDGDRERIPYEADAYLNQLGDYAVHSDYSLARKSHEYLMAHPTWPTEWKQHSIKMAWTDWMWTGDTRSIAKFYDQLKNDKLLERFRRKDGLLLTGGERLRNSLTNAVGAADIVDWPPHERDGFVFRDVNAVINAFYYRNLLEMADIARALGKTADADGFAARAKVVYAAYQKAFFDKKRRVYVDGEGTDHASQHANAAALAFGLVPRDYRRDVVAFCASRGMACSVYFAQYLLEALFEGGRADLAIKLMTSTGDRSWLGMLDQGATVTMEAWAPKYKPNLDLNHAWGAAPINVISRYVLGVTPLEPGCTKVRIAPQVGPLKRVEGRVPTAKGAVRVLVENNEVLTVETPVPARIEFAGQVREVAAGKHVVRLIEAALNPSADWRPSVRWRGFNLLEMFIKGGNAKPKEFREEDFQMIRDWGFNFVRLPMDYRYWIKDGDWEQFEEEHLQYVDRAVKLGQKYGIHVHVCMHRCPGYTVAKPQEGTDLFTDPETQRVCAKHWAMFARRYRGIPNEQLSFNLFNEPPAVADEVYGRVAKILIEAIRREDPTRFILADGLGYGRGPVKSLVGIPGVGQSTRGYTPMSISHYMASWVGTPTAKPVWPIQLDAPNGVLAGRGKPDLQAAVIISNLPPCQMALSYGRVSGRVKIRFTADGETVAEDVLVPQTNSPLWKAVKWYPSWKIFQGSYLGETKVSLPKGARCLEAKIVEGDWMTLGALVVTSDDGTKSAELAFGSDWCKPVNFVQNFCGFDAKSQFASVVAVQEGPRYEDPGMEYLHRKLMVAWDEALAGGTFAMAGEFGCYKYTPHMLVMDWLEDYLRLWKERNMGWAMWNLRGSFGILDSERVDVEYEEFRGHKLDRKMLDLLRKY